MPITVAYERARACMLRELISAGGKVGVSEEVRLAVLLLVEVLPTCHASISSRTFTTVPPQIRLTIMHTTSIHVQHMCQLGLS